MAIFVDNVLDSVFYLLVILLLLAIYLRQHFYEHFHSYFSTQFIYVSRILWQTSNQNLWTMMVQKNSFKCTTFLRGLELEIFDVYDCKYILKNGYIFHSVWYILY